MKITAFELKLALLEYYRFGRQWITVDEFNGADVIVDTGSETIEIEVKLCKSDLTNGERNKRLKHLAYKAGRQYRRCHPNKYLFCVPVELIEVAKQMVVELNPKYGIIAFNDLRLLANLGRGYGYDLISDYLYTVKRGQRLHTGYAEEQRQRIAKRCCSKLITQMQKQYLEKMNDYRRSL